MGGYVEQFLWIETLIKGAIGISLVLAPRVTIRLFVLPETSTAFWPRMIGGLLLGLTLATFLTGAKVINDGIGLGGLAIINLSVAAVLAGPYLAASFRSHRTPPLRSGYKHLGLLALALVFLAVLEIAVR